MATASKIPGSFGQSMAESGLAGFPATSRPSSTASSPRGRASPTLVNVAPDTVSDKASRAMRSLFGYTGTVKASAGKRRKKTKRAVKKGRNRK